LLSFAFSMLSANSMVYQGHGCSPRGSKPNVNVQP
jgi:hypothetical protein